MLLPEVHIPGVGVVRFPYDMSMDAISAASKRLYDEAQAKGGPRSEAPLTRERRPAGAPSALESGHAEGVIPETGFERLMKKNEGGPQIPTDAEFITRAPEVGGAAGMMIGGPLGAGVGASAGSLVKGQFEQGAHMPSRGDLGEAALQGGKNVVLGGLPRTLARGAGAVGPSLAKHAPAISKGASAMAGLGAGIASGDPMTGIGTGAATRMLTDPRLIRGAGHLATRAGAAPAHIANKVGFGAISTEAFRKALMDALGEDEPPR